MKRKKRIIANWEKLYQTQNVRTMPWYSPVLDMDLEAALQKLKIRRGRVLDLGTGPGTQPSASDKVLFIVADDSP